MATKQTDGGGGGKELWEKQCARMRKLTEEYQGVDRFVSFVSMSHDVVSDSDLSQIGGQSESFWEVGNYKRVVKRIDDGAKLCDEMIQLVTERADIEAKYAAKLTRWRKKWEETIDKGSEYGTMESAWKGRRGYA